MGKLYTRQGKTQKRLLKRSYESLLGICTGLMADSLLNNKEIIFLDTWLADHEELATEWPGNVLSKKIREVLADGIITGEEREHLESILNDFIGGTLEESGATSGMATRLPVDKNAKIEIPGNDFCFTGKFLFGERTACEKVTKKKGGRILGSVHADPCFLVIGALASPDWKHSSYGTKIEKAVEYQKKGHNVQIVKEQQWVEAIV